MSGEGLLIYDGDCAFCTSSVNLLQRRIRRHPRCQPWQWLDLETYGVSQADCESAVQYVAGDGRVHSGERAVARTLIAAGKGWALMGRVILLPGIVSVAGLIYRWISRNRHRLPGGTPQCSLSTSERLDRVERAGEPGSQ